MMMNVKIVVDSSANLQDGMLGSLPLASAPLKITVGDTHWVDDAQADPSRLVAYLRNYKGKTSSACPSPEDWATAFGDAEHIFCLTITSALSGCYNSACLAAREYESEHPGRRVHVFDTLSTGAEMQLLAHKIEELCRETDSFDAVVEAVEAYRKNTHLMFVLQSVRNLVNNGRVNSAVGAVVGLLGIRLVGVASEAGQLQMTAKCRNDRKAIAEIVKTMKERGFKGGKAIIDHCANEALAAQLKEAIKTAWADAKVSIGKTRLLCSYYAEEGGLILGFETV